MWASPVLADGKEILLCDLHAIFKDAFKQDSHRIEKIISQDGVHLTAAGNILAAKHIAPILSTLLTGKQANSNGEPAGTGSKKQNQIIDRSKK